MITIVCFNPMVSALVLEHKRLEVCENKTCRVNNERNLFEKNQSKLTFKTRSSTLCNYVEKKKRRRNATNFLPA